ncbi:TIGR01212 family radical SAM protein [Butyrivibrio proteoclasticus]|uniref:TIGR01212 family radical SAM protein n=1 Tax=Butyrivibrio proteoclasticus TaxID=43305 RepID=UPI00047BD180|nr:TIGR01212 family radical SAM protein [Butyrivibrio proteoclasticus]
MPQRLSDYLKREYGEKVYRLSLTSGCSCPNRDGSIVLPDGTQLKGGCTFCSEGGSGEFAARIAPITEQIEEAKERICKKTDARKFIAYFQSYTNTYGDPDKLFSLYKEAIDRSDIVALSIGTRPDCIGPEILDMLKELNKIKPVWIELGLQTIHESTAKAINRGYELPVFEDAYRRLKEAGITVIVHVILGLPGESKEDMLGTVRYLADLQPTLDGIKLQNLQILKGTRMYEQYLCNSPHFHIFSMEEYTDLIAECLALLPKETVVHRMTGDGPRKLLVEPLWTLDKKRVLNTLTRKCSKYFQE